MEGSVMGGSTVHVHELLHTFYMYNVHTVLVDCYSIHVHVHVHTQPYLWVVE